MNTIVVPNGHVRVVYMHDVSVVNNLFEEKLNMDLNQKKFHGTVL